MAAWGFNETGDSASSSIDWGFGAPRRAPQVRQLPPEPGEKLVLDPPEVPITETSKNKQSKVKTKNIGYERTESSIHGSLQHGNVRVINGQLVNNFTPSLDAARAPHPTAPTNTRLFHEFVKGIKQPVSALTEYGGQFKKSIAFKEVAVKKENSMHGPFAFVAITNGYEHPQGVALTKKNAKAKAASIAMYALHGQEPKEEKLGGVANPYNARKGLTISVTDSEFEQQRQTYERDIGFSTVASSSVASTQIINGPTNKTVDLSAPPPGFESTNECDIVYEIFQRKVNFLLTNLEQNPDRLRLSSNFAGFLIQKGYDAAECEVVALAGGSHVIAKEPDFNSKGKEIRDCHAMVLAKRSLQRFFYQEIGRLIAGEVDGSIFSRLDGNKFALKENLQIHLCMTISPCGEALDNGKKLDHDARLTTRDLETIASGEHFPGLLQQSGRVFRKERGLYTKQSSNGADHQCGSVSCSDKLFKWNVLGLQGTLLSYFVEPIYLSSVNIGAKYYHTALVRSICCRGNQNNELTKLNHPYCLSHPCVGRTTNSQIATIDLDREQQPLLAWNWKHLDPQVEIVDPTTGVVTPNSPCHISGNSDSSRVCKSAFLHRYKRLRKDVLQIDDSLSTMSYQDAKLNNKEMSQAKKTFKKQIEMAGKGRWVESDLKQSTYVFRN